ncbi:MAG: hypothetical protein IBX50_15880 [Marinospirillum sp.]|uniref:hypothetical protein n=1 Tax=Marinospirillum sp. TaxID=2183934 RepID=UPI0019F306C5|nr:hypothetical protein [Marinospirillum sp.]MBE0508169.1 hypothetical protein [Marinospirillum sp.]
MEKNIPIEIDLHGLFGDLPSATEGELKKARERDAGFLAPLTVCNQCGGKEYFHRLGCRCTRDITKIDVKWVWMDIGGTILEQGIDFCWIPKK